MKLPGESDAVARWRQRNWDRNLRPPDIEHIINALMHTEIALAAAEQRATDAEATLATIGGADKATLARKLRRAHAATREAEQRATESEARMVDAYRLVDEVMHLADRALYSDDPAERMEKAGQLQTLWNLTLQEALAATAPATQPDERAAAVRANGDAHFLYTDDTAAEAWADDVALFVLHKVTEATSLTLAEITPNLTVPDGWLSFARLWRADYIIVTGDLVQPTDRGIAAMRELLICVADVELEATDGAAKEEM